MKIAYIAAGAAGMYCGSCLHDNTLARALLDLGEEVILIPTYTPLRTDEADVSEDRVFFGGINAYLQQKIPLFRYTPRWMDRLLDSPRLLNLVSRRSSSVDPAKLGDLTVSMLQGELGNQRKEVDKLVDWLIDEVRPDVVHLSNSMLLGMARKIDQRCGPPVVCSLSGEDIFLEKLQPPHYAQARELLKQRAAEVAAFTALNDYYANFMADYLEVERENVHVIPHGMDLSDYPPPPRGEGPGEGVSAAPTTINPKQANLHTTSTSQTRRIGYLARICHDKGLHLLVEACQHLAHTQPGLEFELHAAGYLGEGDRDYFTKLKQKIDSGPLAGRFHYAGEVDRDQKIAFLQSLHLFSTPTVYQESKGLPAIEALAAGVPVVLPDHGSFPELIAQSGGGLLHAPLDHRHLAEQLARLLNDAEHASTLANAGHNHVHIHRTSQQMAQQTLALYGKLLAAT